MISQLKEYLKAVLPFTDEDILFFATKLTFGSLKKGEHFLVEGSVGKQIGFLSKGALRAYYTIDDKEVVAIFFLEGECFSDYTSFVSQRPSTYSIQAISDCEFYLISYEDMQKVYASGQIWERYGRLLAEKLFADAVERRHSFSFNPPEKRYQILLEKQPEILNHIPLKYVAQYLNIEPETLSRIRKKLVSKPM